MQVIFDRSNSKRGAAHVCFATAQASPTHRTVLFHHNCTPAAKVLLAVIDCADDQLAVCDGSRTPCVCTGVQKPTPSKLFIGVVNSTKFIIVTMSTVCSIAQSVCEIGLASPRSRGYVRPVLRDGGCDECMVTVHTYIRPVRDWCTILNF